MSQHNIPKDMGRCPFDSSHVIKHDKMLIHIEKCKIKNQNNTNLQQCPYNPLHYINFTKMQQHQQNCPDRVRFGDDSLQDDDNYRQREEGLFRKKNTKNHKVQQQLTSGRGKQINNRPFKQNQLWQEPNFTTWYKNTYNPSFDSPTIVNFQNDTSFLSSLINNLDI